MGKDFNLIHSSQDPEDDIPITVLTHRWRRAK